MRRLLVCCLTLLSLTVPVGAPAAEPGLNVPGADSGGSDEAMAMLRDTGARWARHFLEWDRFEPSRGSFDTALIGAYQRTMDREAAVGANTILTVVRSPSWASGSADPNSPPADPKDFAAFIGRIAREFAGRVEVIEIWNEQDEAIFWAGAVSAARYADLLKAAYPAVKAADPSIRVAFGPTTGNNYAYLQQAYDAGAKGSFDAVSVHTDTSCSITSPNEFYREGGRIARFSFLGYREVRATMLANGDDKPIFMSELGWSTTTTTCERGAWAGQKAAGVSEAKQALFLEQAYHCLKEDPYVELALWFEAKDRSAADTELTRYGLRRADGTNKPAYAAFKSFHTSGDPLTGACGDFTAPTIRVFTPTPGWQVYDKLVLRADTLDRDVARMSFFVDGQLVENFTPNLAVGEKTRDYVRFPALRDWQGVRSLSFGAHALTVVAKDSSGNESEKTVPFTRVNPVTLPWRSTRFRDLRFRRLKAARTYTYGGHLVSPGVDFGVSGKVRITWENRRKGRFTRIHGGTQDANEPFLFRQRLKYRGTWRVRLTYRATKPYRSSVTRWRTFRVR
jgi:hypothetical protein